MYEDFILIYNDIYENNIKNELIIRRNESIFKLTESMRTLLAEYKDTENIELLKQAIRVQVDQITPEARHLRMLKYEVMEMERREPVYTNAKPIITLDENCQLDIKIKIDSDIFEHVLVQRPVELTKMEYLTEEPPNVIKFIK